MIESVKDLRSDSCGVIAPPAKEAKELMREVSKEAASAKAAREDPSRVASREDAIAKAASKQPPRKASKGRGTGEASIQ